MTRRKSLLERTLSKIQFGDDCWLWTGATGGVGYGHIMDTDGETINAHIVTWRLFRGPVPEGMELDHLCHTDDQSCMGGACIHRRCVNPWHLEPVTHQENMARGRWARATHCKHGHEYTEENTYRYTNRFGNPARSCRECTRIRQRREYAEKRLRMEDT